MWHQETCRVQAQGSATPKLSVTLPQLLHFLPTQYQVTVHDPMENLRRMCPLPGLSVCWCCRLRRCRVAAHAPRVVAATLPTLVPHNVEGALRAVAAVVAEHSHLQQPQPAVDARSKDTVSTPYRTNSREQPRPLLVSAASAPCSTAARHHARHDVICSS